MTKQRANKDVARTDAGPTMGRRVNRSGAVKLAAAAATLGLLLTVGAAGEQDIGTGPATPPATLPAAGQAYPNGAPGQPFPAQPPQPGAGGEVPAPAVVAPVQTPPPAPESPAMVAPAPAPAMAMTPITTQPASQPVAAAGPSADSGLRVDAGRSVILHLARLVKLVSLGDPAVAAVNVMPGGQGLLITGKKGGSTALVVVDDMGKSTVYDLTVDPDFTALRKQLKASFPTAAVEALPLNDSIALHGTVPSDQVAAQVVEMANTFAKVHNFMTVAGGQQVMLQIRFAELDRSAVRNLGINFGGTDGVSSFGNNVGQVNPLGFITSGTSLNGLALGAQSAGSAITLFGQGQFGRTAFAYFLQALEENGLVRIMAEPNVVAINGQEASFIAGGEFPVPVSQGGGTGAGSAVTVQYQEYGIRLNFTPLVLGQGNIRLKVAPEVSELDFANAVRSNGFLIPALTKRKVSTTVELADGQSFALAGLMDDTTSTTTDAVPILGDIPILGMLFRSTKYQRQQTELVVLVTPHLVAATDPDTTAALPGEHWRYPTDAQAYFKWDMGGDQLGKPAKDGEKGADRNLASTVPPRSFHGTYGFTPNGAGGVDAATAGGGH
jgi:pilus assembly protein CpaC